MKIRHYFILFFAALVSAFPVSADLDPVSSKVLVQSHGHAPINSDLRDAAWLIGHWQGSRFPGHIVEHIILPDTLGHMPGFVRSQDQESIYFFEITNFETLDGVLHYRVKHFSDDLTGWEAAEEVISRPLLGRSDRALQFDSITFERTSDDSFTVYYRFPDGDREGEILVIPFERFEPAGFHADQDRETVVSILSDLDDPALLPAEQLKNYVSDAVILAPGQAEIRGHAAIEQHLADARQSARIEMRHDIVELSAFEDIVLVQGGATGTAQPHGDPNRYPFETKSQIMFKRMADGSLKIWKVIYNDAPTIEAQPERVAEHAFEDLIGTWRLKDNRFEQVWDGKTAEVLDLPEHRTVCSPVNTTQSVLCRVNAGDFQGHILWAWDEAQQSFGHLSHFGSSRLGQGTGRIGAGGDLRVTVSFSDEPDGTYREYHYDWVTKDEYEMRSIQYDAEGTPTGNYYAGRFVRE